VRLSDASTANKLGMDRAQSSDPRARDPRGAEATDPKSGTSDDPRVDPTPDLRQTTEPKADAAMETEERDVTPERRAEPARSQAQDP
jgi:hypothetical protein